MINLTNCPISGDALEPIISLGPQPIFMGTTDTNVSGDQLNEMTWGATKNGIVHLISRVPLGILYSQSHNSGLIGGVWQRHHFEFAQFIAKYSPKEICEIGGGHGILNTNYSRIKGFSSWDIYEPNAKKSSDSRVKVYNQFFDAKTELNKKDCILHSHLFEHLYDHSTILDNVYSSLNDDGMMIFSLPNMKKMLQNGYVNSLNFEHVTYLPEDLIEYLLEKSGFVVDTKEYFLDDHSIFYACKKIPVSPVKKYSNPENINMVKNFFQTEMKKVKSINETLIDKHSVSDVYLFGAHIFSQFYVNNGLDNNLVKGILDNDPSKQNQRLYGTNLTVNDPTVIASVEKPVVIVKVGAYKDEIISQLKNINKRVEIVE